MSFSFKSHSWLDVMKCFLVRQALKGLWKEYVRRECGHIVSYSLLSRLLEATEGQCSSQYEVVLFRACFCLAFFGALRVGELVPPAKSWACWKMMWYWLMAQSLSKYTTARQTRLVGLVVFFFCRVCSPRIVELTCFCFTDGRVPAVWFLSHSYIFWQCPGGASGTYVGPRFCLKPWGSSDWGDHQ